MPQMVPHKCHVGKESHVGIFFIHLVHDVAFDVAFDVAMEKVTWQPIKMTWHA